MAAYQLAENHNNAAGFVEMRTIVVDGRPLAHITSLGTFEAARLIEGLDGITVEDGDDKFTWTFEWMSPEELAYIRDTFLDGRISGYVTAETKNDRREWVECNATLTIPRAQPLRGEYYGPVIFEFSEASLLP